MTPKALRFFELQGEHIDRPVIKAHFPGDGAADIFTPQESPQMASGIKYPSHFRQMLGEVPESRDLITVAILGSWAPDWKRMKSTFHQFSNDFN